MKIIHYRYSPETSTFQDFFGPSQKLVIPKDIFQPEMIGGTFDLFSQSALITDDIICVDFL